MTTSPLNTIDLKDKKMISDYFYKSDFYEIKTVSYDFEDDIKPIHGYNECFCIVLIQNGQFKIDLNPTVHALYTGWILIDKPQVEYAIRPAIGKSTVIKIYDHYFQGLLDELEVSKNSFLANTDLISLLFKSNPGLDYLHYQILKNPSIDKIAMDAWVLEILHVITSSISNRSTIISSSVEALSHQLPTIERAKEYIHLNYYKDFTIFQLAKHALSSPYHFIRLFKKYTGFTPQKYVQTIRLKHSAHILCQSPKMSIAEIAFNSGFNNTEYFATLFKQKYGTSPTTYQTQRNITNH